MKRMAFLFSSLHICNSVLSVANVLWASLKYGQEACSSRQESYHFPDYPTSKGLQAIDLIFLPLNTAPGTESLSQDAIRCLKTFERHLSNVIHYWWEDNSQKNKHFRFYDFIIWLIMGTHSKRYFVTLF